MIKVENVSKYYGNFKALNNLSFEIGKGEVVGFLGPNGAGKTTTLKILTCNSYPHKGTVNIGGFDVIEDSKKVQEKIGYLPESAPLYKDMLVHEYLAFMAEARGLGPSRRKKAIRRVVNDCGIEKYLYRPVSHLSKGYRQRVGLAQALLNEPDVLILDEPYTGLDPIQIIEIRNLIKEYGKTHTVILSSHILQEVEATCSRILIINEGQIVADDSVDNLLAKNSIEVVIAGEDPLILKKFNEMDKIKIMSHESWTGDTESGLKLVIEPGEKSREQLSKEIHNICKEEGWTIHTLGEGKVTFEDLFVSFTAVEKKEKSHGK